MASRADELIARLDILKKRMRFLSMIFVLLLVAIIADIIRIAFDSEVAYWLLVVTLAAEGFVYGRIHRLTKDVTALRLELEAWLRDNIKPPPIKP